MGDFNKIVDRRMAAEIVSVSYLHCILKGLHKAPKVIDYDSKSKDTLRVDDIDLMISPDGCWGDAHEACANWGIPIIFVQENKNIYEPYTTRTLPEKCFLVKDYIEAAGIIASWKAGVTVSSVRRTELV